MADIPMSDIVQDLSIFTGPVNDHHHPLSCICFQLQSSYLLVSIVYDGSCKLGGPQLEVFHGCIVESFVFSGLMANLRPPLELGEVVMFVAYLTLLHTHTSLYAKVQQKESPTVHLRHSWTVLSDIQIKWKLQVGLLRLVACKLLHTGCTVYIKLKMLKKHIATNI